MCTGVEGKSSPHLSFIYKNIKGKPYCKQCTFLIQPPKPIKKISKKQQIKNVSKAKKTEEQFEFFLEIWEERKHSDGFNYCEVTGEKLPTEPLSIYFDHLLEKSIYPQYRFDKNNIAIVSSDVHLLKTNGFPLPKHKELIEQYKNKINKNVE